MANIVVVVVLLLLPFFLSIVFFFVLLKKDIDYDWYGLRYFSHFLVTLHDLFDSALRKKNTEIQMDEVAAIKFTSNNINFDLALMCWPTQPIDQAYVRTAKQINNIQSLHLLIT